MDSNLVHFLSDTPWHHADIVWFDADWSVRRYARLTNNAGDTAILLQSPPDNSPDAMIGHLVGEWVDINRHLQSLDLNVPTIIKQDLSQAFILMSDFGTQTIANKGLHAYLKATDILIHMRDHPDSLSIPLKKYEDTHVYKALRFFPSYVCQAGEKEWFTTWKKIETSLPNCPRALTHIDYAPQNLMWTHDKIGIIDFQAACDGPFVYDLVNLLEDIRIDVPEAIKQSCKNHFCASLSPQDKDIFEQWYIVITAQFHARILGQIQYLSQEKGRDDLIKYYAPLMHRYKKEIDYPLLEGLKDFIE